MKYAAIHHHRLSHRIARQCAVLGVSRSGYYAWLGRAEMALQRQKAKGFYPATADGFVKRRF